MTTDLLQKAFFRRAERFGVRPAFTVIRFILFTVAGVFPFPAQAASSDGAGNDSERNWIPSWDAGLRQAEADDRPLLVYFHSPDSEWCARLEGHWMDAAIDAALESYATVRLDAGAHARIAVRERIRSVPTILIVDPATGTRRRHTGYQGPDALRAFLENGARSPDPDQAQPAGFEERLRALGYSRDRRDRIESILQEDPFPAEALLAALENRSLQVRLGAIEVLEARAGQTYGYDPWLPPGEQTGALHRWGEWGERLAEGDPLSPATSSFTAGQVEGYVTELFSSDVERSRRAIEMLMEGGHPVARHIREMEESPRDLSRRERLLLRQVRYAAILSEWRADRPRRLAQELLFGNPSIRMDALARLAGHGGRALPLIEEFLSDPDPVLRESAVETLAQTGGAQVIPSIEERWEEETNTDVLIGILRAVGEIEDESTVRLLTRALDHEAEDIAVLALDYLRHLSDFSHDSDAIGRLLDDSRWRVRAAALEAIQDLRLYDLADRVEPLLHDEDEFVRLTAISALGRIGSGASRAALEEVFRDQPDYRLDVLNTFISNDWQIPGDFAEIVFNDLPAGQETELVSAIGTLREKQLPLARRFLEHPNPDYRIAAIQSLAARGTGDEATREELVTILRQGTPPEQIALMREFDPAYADVPRIGVPNARDRAPEQKNFLQRLFSGSEDESDEEAEETPGDHPLAPFEEAGVGILEVGETPEMRLAAAKFLTRIGSKKGLDHLIDRLDQMNQDELSTLIGSLQNVDEPHIHDLLVRMFPHLESHEWGIVRNLFQRGSHAENLEFLLSHAPSPITTEYVRFLDDVPQPGPLNRQERNAARALIREIFENRAEPALRCFALIHLQHVLDWTEDRDWIMEQTRADNPLLRRAAWRLVTTEHPGRLPEFAETIAGDPDYRVREVLPAAVQMNESWWENHYGEHYSGTSWSHSIHLVGTTRPDLDETVEGALRQLSEDPVRSLRTRAAIALADARGVIEDPDRMAAYIESVDQADNHHYNVQSWISRFVYTHYENMGLEHEKLLRFVRESDNTFGTYERRNIDVLRAHFEAMKAPEGDSAGSGETSSPVARVQEDRDPASVPVPGDNGAPEPRPAEDPEGAAPIPVIFFTQSGCPDCARVREYLSRLEPVFPQIEVRSHSIRTADSIRLNEHLSETFQVPIDNRLVAPAVFTAAGPLVRDEISMDALSELLSRSWETDPAVLRMPSEAVAITDDRIVERFHGFTLPVVLSAGLLDGLNPCAFATIIFFLSYLQVARRSPFQILQVGVAFVTGIFLTYLAIGVGFMGIMERVTLLEPVAVGVNWTLAGFVLVICLLSLRDGFLCLRGKLEQTALQLPKPLKNKINALIRTGVRHSHFVIGAFLIGAAIAVLELACTGQMYAPTIMLVLQSGAERLAAAGYLLLYNIGFVLPLILIVLLAWRGLTSQRLTTFFRNNVAFVKFANAALFAALFLFFVTVLF